MVYERKLRSLLAVPFIFVLVSVSADLHSTIAAAPTAAEVQVFIENHEKVMEGARNRLLQAIKKRDTAIRQSRTMTVDAIRSARKEIEVDRKAFEADGTLPKSDELIDAVIACVDQYQGIADRIEKFRQRIAERSVRAEDPADMDRLTSLESRLNDVVAGRERFTVGSTWSGRRHTREGALHLQLTIQSMSGNNFSGALRQTGEAGNVVRMVVEGELRGNRIAFHNTEMLRGKQRSLNFHGYVLSDRIITSVGGTNYKGRAATGWINLWTSTTPREKRRG